MNLNCLEIAYKFGLTSKGKKGEEVLFLCPVHDDHSPSLSINASKNVWMCGPCREDGNPWKLAAFLLGVSPEDKKTIASWLKENNLISDNGFKPQQAESTTPPTVVEKYEYRDGWRLFVWRKTLLRQNLFALCHRR